MKDANTVELNLPARLESLGVLEACVTALMGQETALTDREARTFEVVLAVHETCTNIIEHAYGATAGRVRVAFTFLDGPRRLAIDFDDSGQSFDLAQVQSPNLDEAQTSGYGIFLVRRLMDEVDYRPAPGNNRWRLVKRLE